MLAVEFLLVSHCIKTPVWDTNIEVAFVRPKEASPRDT